MQPAVAEQAKVGTLLLKAHKLHPHRAQIVAWVKLEGW